MVSLDVIWPCVSASFFSLSIISTYIRCQIDIKYNYILNKIKVTQCLVCTNHKIIIFTQKV